VDVVGEAGLFRATPSRYSGSAAIDAVGRAKAKVQNGEPLGFDMTDRYPSGTWTCNVAKGSSGTITPVKAGYTFTPASRAYSGADFLENLDFEAAQR
jgi:hypothetical protein